MIIKNWLTRETLQRVPADTLEGADLAGLDLSFGYFVDVSLRNANLSRANLTGAYFNNADLKGANLCGANLITPQSCLHEFWNAYGPAVYDALLCVKDEYLQKGTPRAQELWVTFTHLLLLAGVSGSIKGALYDDMTRWPESFEPDTPRKNGARHIQRRAWWRPWA